MSAHTPNGSGASGPIARRRFLGGALALGGTIALPAGPASASLQPRPDVACATITEQGFVASVKTTAPARVRIEAWPVGSPGRKVQTGWHRTNDATAAVIAMPQVALPGEAWTWRGLVQASSGQGPVVPDRLRTLPARPAPGEPSTFTFAHGSCILQKHPIPSLDVARQAKPVFFAMIGDLGYQDDPVLHPFAQTYDRYVELFRRILVRRDMSRLLEVTPLYAVQDDHDYGQNDAWRDTIKPYAAKAYADLIPGASWPAPDYRRWSIGEVDFFLTDNRRYRDPPHPPYENGTYRSVLGTAQRTWLLDGLASSTARVKVVFIPMTMTWYWSDGERNEVLQWIADNVSGTVIFSSGDKHAGAFVRYADNVWELLAAPIENPSKHLTPSRPGVVWTENGTGRALYDVIALVDVDTLRAQTVTLRLMRDDGHELHREVVPIA